MLDLNAVLREGGEQGRRVHRLVGPLERMGTGHGADECDDRVALGGGGEQSGYEIEHPAQR